MSMIPNVPWARTAVIVLALSAVTFVTTAVRAIRVTPVEAAASPALAASRTTLAPAPAPSIDADAIGANDIFRPDRSALPHRYRMPGETGPDTTTAPEALRPMVLGTVLATDGSHFATCQLPGGRATLVRVGDRLGEYTVSAIERDKVVFLTAKGARIEVTTKRPGT